MSTAKSLIRLSGCPGQYESSLGAQSFCWFCHKMAHFLFQNVQLRAQECKYHAFTRAVQEVCGIWS